MLSLTQAGGKPLDNGKVISCRELTFSKEAHRIQLFTSSSLMSSNENSSRIKLDELASSFFLRFYCDIIYMP